MSAWWLVVYLKVSCPGWILSGLIPQSVTPLVCEQKSEAQIISQKKDAFNLAIDLELKDRGPRLFYCKNLKCYEKEIKTIKSVEIR